VADTVRLAPEKALLTPGWRSASVLANLYILPPAFAETNQYYPFTRTMEESYLATPGHNLLRGMVGGGLMLAFTLLGMISGVINLRRATPDKRRTLVLVLLVTTLQTLALIAMVPLTWQRYVIPLVPLACLWIAYGLAQLLRQITKKGPSRETAPAKNH
jgi:hypothetical protein